MKRIMIAAVCIVALTACKQKENNAAELAFQQQRDSLTRIIEQKDNEIDDMMATMNDIQEGVRAINEAEERVTIAKDGEGATSAERIRENMEFIQGQMQQNRELISKLRNQLRQSSVKTDQMRRTLENLTQQSEAKDKQLNTAWFVYGTKKELKEQHIIEDGKVLRSNFNREYFTKIDIRIDKEIRLYSRSANILTAHPQSSYTLQQDANKQYILRITNPQLFWSTSKYLVVLVK